MNYVKYVKAIVAVAVLLLAAQFIRGSLYPRYRCHVVVTQNVRNNTEALVRLTDSVLVSMRARDNLAELAPCLELTPWDLRLQMLAGGNHSLRGQHDRAAQAYETALAYDRRAETHMALGRELIELARTEEAMKHLVLACSVHPDWSAELLEPIRGEVNARVLAIRGGKAR